MTTPTDTEDAYEGLPPQSPEEEATMQEEIDRLMAQYEAVTPASLRPVLREKLEHALRTHPYPRQLIKAFAKRTPGGVSAEGRVDGTKSDGEKAGGEGEA
jgi:hypothetical protein